MIKEAQRALARQGGFTLIEMVFVIVVTGILAAGFAGFVKASIEGYQAVRTRSELAQAAQLSMQRARRELRLALPNSVRATQLGSAYYLEFAPAPTGGRYRLQSATGADSAPACDLSVASIPDNGALSLGQPDLCFKTIGPFDASLASAGNWVVINNMGPGYAGADYYESGNATGGNKAKLTAAVSSLVEGKVDMEANAFPFDSPGHRFFIATGPVSYVCDPSAKEIRRYWGYQIQSSQPTAGLGSLAGVKSAPMLKNVASCSISYSPASVAARYGLVSVQANMLAAGSNVILQLQAHVSNVP